MKALSFFKGCKFIRIIDEDQIRTLRDGLLISNNDLSRVTALIWISFICQPIEELCFPASWLSEDNDWASFILFGREHAFC